MTPQQIAVQFYGKPTRDPQTGFLDVPVVIAKKMVMSYEYDDNGDKKVVNELLDLPYNDKEFVASCDGLPFIIDHPLDDKGNPVDFNKDNFKDIVKGIIINPKSVPDEEAIYGKLRVWDSTAAEMIENREIVEVSQGYLSTDKKQSGTYNGKHYDIVQTPQPFNHLAGVDAGRSGEDVRILYNSKQSKPLKVNSAVAVELYDKFLKGEIMRKQYSQKLNASEPEKKPEEEKPKENDETLTPEQDADKDTQILSVLSGLSKVVMAMAEKMGIGGENQNSDDKAEPEEKDKMKEDIMNKVNSEFTKFNSQFNILQMQAYREREEAVQRAGMVIGGEAPELLLKCNSVDDFKRIVLVKAGRDEQEVKKYNSMEANAHFRAVTDEIKRNMNQPRFEMESHLTSGEMSSGGTY